MSCDLSGTGVLVTRAAHQAEPLCKLIEAQGGRAVRFPVLEIEPLKPADLKQDIKHSDIVIFISPNAVRCGMDALGDTALLNGRQIAAVGKATAHALIEAGVQVTIVPEQQADSESLLAHPLLQQVSNKQIVIIRGIGGRALLGDSLNQRGAEVTYAEVYQRRCPQHDAKALLKLWPQQIDIATSTSIDMLNNLVRLLGERGAQLLRGTPLLVISSRMEARAKELGVEQIILADGASDQAIIAALCNWRQQMNPAS